MNKIHSGSPHGLNWTNETNKTLCLSMMKTTNHFLKHCHANSLLYGAPQSLFNSPAFWNTKFCYTSCNYEGSQIWTYLPRSQGTPLASNTQNNGVLKKTDSHILFFEKKLCHHTWLTSCQLTPSIQVAAAYWSTSSWQIQHKIWPGCFWKCRTIPLEWTANCSHKMWSCDGF